jgi:hypothetical protein
LNNCLTTSISSNILVFGNCSTSFGVVRGLATSQDLRNSLGIALSSRERCSSSPAQVLIQISFDLLRWGSSPYSVLGGCATTAAAAAALASGARQTYKKRPAAEMMAAAPRYFANVVTESNLVWLVAISLALANTFSLSSHSHLSLISLPLSPYAHLTVISLSPH